MKKLLLTVILAPLLFIACSGPKLILLERPVFDKHYMSKAAIEAMTEKPPRPLTFTLEEEKTDSLPYAESCKSWFNDNGVVIKAMTYHDGFEMMPLHNMHISTPWISKYRTYATKTKTYSLAHVVEQEHAVLLFYGDRPNEFNVINNVSILIVRDKLTEALKYAFDFNEFVYPPDFTEKSKDYVYEDLLWAYIDNSMLYVSNAHWTYSSSTKDQNGYITAISLKDKKVVWRTAPKVANSINFLVIEGMIFSAYGYTREEAKLYAIDKNTGKITGEIQLAAPRSGKKHIEFMYNSGNNIYLKAFDNTAYKIKFE